MKIFVSSSSFIFLLLLLTTTLLVVIQNKNKISALRFGIIGDWGMGGRKTPWDTEIRSAAAYNEACETFFSEGSCNLTISCGDNIYTPDVQMGLRESFGLFSKNTGPFFPVSGNHDNMNPQIDYSQKNRRWKWPQRYYDFKVSIDNAGRDGHTVHFFALDVMDGGLREGGGQYKWLEEKLESCNSRWKIFFAHFPVVGAGRHRREGSVTSISKLMDKYNVQVFFSGHDHILDVNVMQGKVMPISGAMARGGMMLRGIAGASHQFTLSQPGEFNQYKVDWPGHGFFTAELSANILTVHSWDHYGGIMYSFQTTQDWVAKVHKMPSSMENKFPPASEVKAAAQAEKDLPRGPGGGKLYDLDGNEFDAPKFFSDKTDENTGDKVRNTEKPMDTSYTKFKDEVPITLPSRIDQPTNMNFGPTMSAEEKVQTTERETIANYIRYTVSSECMNCERDIYANESFSVYVVGMDLSSKARLFISTSKIGCTMSKYYPKRVLGTSIIQPTGNQAVFTASQRVETAYVCLSLDAGKNYNLLKRIDDAVMVDDFIIKAPRSAKEKLPVQNNNNNNNNNNQPETPSPPQKPDETGDTLSQPMDNSSTGQFLVIVGVGLIIGLGIVALSKSEFLDELTNPQHNNNSGNSSSRRQQRLANNDDEGGNGGDGQNLRDTGAVDE